MSGNGGYGVGRPRFSDSRRRDWAKRYRSGQSVPSIATAYGCSANTIYHHLSSIGIYAPGKDRPAIEVVGTGACIRCGIRMGVAGMCLDCLEVEGLVKA